MEITVIEEDENPMLRRTDVTFEVSHAEATPDRLAIRDSLAARLGKNADEVVVRRLDTKFGMRTTIGEAKVYEAPEHARDVEQDYMLERNKIASPEGEEAAGAEAEAEAEVEPDAEPEPEVEEETEAEEAEAEGAEAEEVEEEADEEAEEADAADDDDDGVESDADADADAEAEEAE